MNMPSPNWMMYQVGRLPPEHSNHCSSVCHNACASTSLIKMEICVLETNKLNIHQYSSHLGGNIKKLKIQITICH